MADEAAAKCRQALPIVGPDGSWGLATGAHVEAAERWMAPGRWGWTGGGRGRLIGVRRVLKAR